MMRQHTQPTHIFTLGLILLVLLLAALLRIYNITQQSIWFDEAFAWNIVIQPDMYPRIAADTHPPLYYILLRGWMTLTGDSPLALRYLSALIGMVTVAFVYQIGRELVRGRSSLVAAPVLAALVIALSDAEIFLAQEARNYTLYTCLASLSMWAYLRWLRTGTRGAAAAWVLATAGLAYTHYQGLFIPAIQGVHALIFLREIRRVQAVGLLAAAGLIFLPWFVGVTIPQAQNAIDNSLPYSIPSNWSTFLHLKHSYLGAQWALMMLLMLAGLVVLARGRMPRRAAGDVFLVALWLLLPFGVLFFGNYFASLLTERKLLIIVPALALMIGFGIGGFSRWARILLAAALVIYGLSAVDYYRVKEPWDDIARTAVQYARGDDLALIEVGVGQYPMKYYWSRWMPEGVRVSTFPVLGDFTMGQTDWYTYYEALLPQLIDEATAAARAANRNPTVWLVFWSREEANFQRLDEAGYTRTMAVTFDHLGNDIHLYRYDRIPADSLLGAFDSGMALRAAEIDADALRFDLWWSAADDAEPIGGNYTISALLLDEDGRLVAQRDSYPFDGARPTRGWAVDEIIYDPRPLTLVDGLESLPPGTYTAAVQVYRFGADGATIEMAHPADADADDPPYIVIRTFTVD